MVQTSAKQRATQAVGELPEDATLEDAIERLIFLRKIERGLEQREAGEGSLQEDVERRMGVSWGE